MRAAIVEVGLVAAALGDDAGLEQDTCEEAAGGCGVPLFEIGVQGRAAGRFIERLGGLLEELRTVCNHQVDERLAQAQAGLDVLIAARWDGPFLESGDLGAELEGFARGRITLGQRARPLGPAAA